VVAELFINIIRTVRIDSTKPRESVKRRCCWWWWWWRCCDVTQSRTLL